MRDKNLYRSSSFELRDSADGSMPVMSVNFARFNEWTQINSVFEGRFMEQFAPGAFKKTFAEQADQIRAIFQHGQDPVAGLKPLGPVQDLHEAQDGAYGEVQLLNADYVKQIEPGLRAGLYGASFAFQVVREDVNEDPGTSDTNPQGLPERTVREARLREFGPVTFGAYAGASAGIRSLTDDILAKRDPDGFREFAERVLKSGPDGLPVPDDTEKDADKTSDEDEQAPADRATPAVTLARIAWLRKQRADDGAPGAQLTPR